MIDYSDITSTVSSYFKDYSILLQKHYIKLYNNGR